MSLGEVTEVCDSLLLWLLCARSDSRSWRCPHDKELSVASSRGHQGTEAMGPTAFKGMNPADRVNWEAGPSLVNPSDETAA